MTFAESALGPGIDAAFLRIPGRQFADSQAHRHEEQEPGQDPKGESAGPRSGGGREPPKTEDGDDVEENEISESEGAWQLRSGLVG